MTRYQTRRLQQRLRRCGWWIEVDGYYGPQTAATVAKFQRGFYRPDKQALPITGRALYGSRTWYAIRWSARHDGRCSPHFRWDEFRSKGNGDIVVYRALLASLERLRNRIDRSIFIVSGYRDPYYNSRINGAKYSQHKYGTASDIPESLRVTREDARAAGFSGIGYDASSGFVQHVDRRDAGPNNTTGASTGHPTFWTYP